MQFNFKSDPNKKPSAKMNLIPALGLFWQKIYKTIFFIFLLSIIGLGAYVWQRSLSGGQWSAEKKQEYLDSQNKVVIFKENDFKKALIDIELRKQGNVGDWQVVKDIFKAY